MKNIFAVSLFLFSFAFTQESDSYSMQASFKEEKDASLSLLVSKDQNGTYTIIGTVIDQSSREPIGRAKVTLLGTNFTSTTSTDGQFRMESIPEGIYQIKAEAVGYESSVVNNVSITSERKKEQIFFTLQKESQEPAEFISVDKQPMPIPGNTPPPVYPEIARRAGVEGTVWIKIWVDEMGSAHKAIVQKSDVEIFNQPAIDAAMKWKFTPAILHDKPVAVWVVIPFKFALHENFVSPEDVDEKPSPIKSVVPKYPQSAKQLNIEGTVWVEALIDEHGKVQKVKFKQMYATDHKTLNQTFVNFEDLKSEDASRACSDMSKAAVESAKQWKFSPGKKNGKAVKTNVIIPVKYALSKTKSGNKK